jgi:hypothetical protein
MCSAAVAAAAINRKSPLVEKNHQGKKKGAYNGFCSVSFPIQLQTHMLRNSRKKSREFKLQVLMH